MRGHISVSFALPQFTGCAGEKGLMYRDVRLCQGRVVFLHSSILCRIWEESLNYSVTCITAHKSVYNQGLGFCPYLWMTRAESGPNSSTDTVCELHNCCGYMTLLLRARPWDRRDIWQRLCSLLWTAQAQWGRLLYKHASPAHLKVLLLILPPSLVKSEIPLLQIICYKPPQEPISSKNTNNPPPPQLLTSLSTNCWLFLPFINSVWIQGLYCTWWNIGQSVAISSTAALVVDVKHSYFSRGHFKWEPDPGHYYQNLLLSPSAEGVEASMLPGGEKQKNCRVSLSLTPQGSAP